MLQEYQSRINSGRLEPDSAQAALVERFDALAKALAAHRRAATSLRSLFTRALFRRSSTTASPRGLYIHGSVGCGKTMLMDLFFEHSGFEPRQRSHFHEFMADVHDRIAAARKTTPGDPIPLVATEIAASGRLLCFDELHVTNIADAMILGRLFAQLFKSGVTVVATSNTKPGDLYKNGLNRDLFLPFIALIEQHMDVMELYASKDYRLQKLSGRPLYFTPADDQATRQLDAAFAELTGLARGHHRVMDIKGHKLEVPQAAMGVARFTFTELCDRPLGTLDYLRLAHTFHTIMIDAIPRLTPEHRNAARRFINLIDTLYDCGVCLIASAEAEPDKLYVAGDGVALFERTASRLYEMRSAEYLKERRAHPADPSAPVSEAPSASAEGAPPSCT